MTSEPVAFTRPCPALKGGEESLAHSSINSADDGFQRRHDDVLVDAHAEDCPAVRQAQFHVGHSTGICAVAHGVFAIVDHVEGEAGFFAERITEAVDGAVALALDGFDVAVHRNLGGDGLLAVV